jgi:hypothetical protein
VGSNAAVIFVSFIGPGGRSAFVFEGGAGGSGAVFISVRPTFLYFQGGF